MVDFNNEATISTPATEVVRILILQRRNDCIESIEAFLRTHGKTGGSGDLYEVRARMHSLFLELQALLKRRLQEDQNSYDGLRGIIVNRDSNLTQLINAFEFMNELLDDLRIIRVDTKKHYDTTRVLDEDEAHGL